MASSLMPMFNARRRTDRTYHPSSVYGGGKQHDYDQQYSNNGGGKHHDYDQQYSNNHQTSAITSPYAHQNHSSYQTSNYKSSPLILDDGTIEWKETPEAHVLRTRLPAGVRREDVKVQIEDDQVLKIIGERVTETEDRHSSWQHHELSRAKFLTAMKLPEDARVDLIKSFWEDGVLTVRIPRREVINHHHPVRNVEISNHY